ncbi:MAG: pyridoxal 5'-phosphate synthase glutaminase subunit PdxT [Chloroflexota bacterium]
MSARQERPGRDAPVTIGVLALQGAVAEHVATLHRLGVQTVEVRLPWQLDGLDGLIIPGGESTTIGKLATTYNLRDRLRAFIAAGSPVYGSCAGLIMLADRLDQGQDQPLLGGMDMTVRRNAFGRQGQSFEQSVPIPALGSGTPFRAIFIRAPLITAVGPGVDVLAQLPGGGIVAARQGNLLATAFHPELSDDLRLHALFLEMCRQHGGGAAPESAAVDR